MIAKLNLPEKSVFGESNGTGFWGLMNLNSVHRVMEALIIAYLEKSGELAGEAY
jgi:hypothetical protein